MSIKQELIPPFPDRYETETEIDCLINAFFEGLDDVGVDLEIFAEVPEIKTELRRRGYEMPEKIWDRINELTCREQAWVIYTMLRAMHIWSKLRLMKVLESLEGKEFLFLPLELAGEDNFLSLLSMIETSLPQFGLDKGRTQGEGNGIKYPTVWSTFLKTRREFFELYHLDSFESLAWFLMNLKAKLGYWPEDLLEIFDDRRAILRAMEGIDFFFQRADVRAKRPKLSLTGETENRS